MLKISVIMPNYNCEKYIGEAIESVLSQSFEDFEFIILDDGSTDKSWDIILDYSKKDGRIRAYQNKKNLGITKTRNKLLSLCKGDFIAMIDSDDTSFPTRLEKQYNFMVANPEIGLCGTNFQLVDENGNYISTKKEPKMDIDIKRVLFFKCPFGQNTIMMRKEIYESLGGYNENFSVSEDLEYWIRISEKYKLHNLQEPLSTYRIHGKNSIYNKTKEMLKNVIILRKRMINNGYKMSFMAYLIYYIGYLGYYCPWFGKYIINPPKSLVRILHIFKII